MPSYRLSNKALDDLRSIACYTEKNWGRAQRNKYLSKMDTGFQLIADEPQLGRACDDIRKGYRKYHAGRHLIFYRQTRSHIEIIRILHERMDVDSRLQG